jgi:hypothetical protein
LKLLAYSWPAAQMSTPRPTLLGEVVRVFVRVSVSACECVRMFMYVFIYYIRDMYVNCMTYPSGSGISALHMAAGWGFITHSFSNLLLISFCKVTSAAGSSVCKLVCASYLELVNVSLRDS